MEDKIQENDSQCVICGEKIEYYSIGQCNHREICYYCTLKNRTFYNDKKCPLCNTNLEIVFISPKSEISSFEELSKKELSSYYKDNDSDEIGVYYTDITSLETSLQLKSYKCPIDYCVKEEPFNSYEDLVQHLKDNHQKLFCKVCVKYGKKFITEQKVYSKNEINEHNWYGDIDEDIPPHHKCPYCGDLYYDDEMLYSHMSKTHFMCDICKNIDKKTIFYSALPNFIEHNRFYHYCCPFKECKDVLYIAFPSKKQLIEHFEKKHNQNNNNLNEKMANENLPKIFENPTLYDISMKKDEFNFNEFLDKVNKRCLQHRENKKKTNYIEENDINDINPIDEKNINNINNNKNVNTNGIEIIYENPRNENYQNKRGNWRGKWRGRGGKIRGNNDYFLIKKSFNNYIEEEEQNYNKIKIKELDYEFLINYFLQLIKEYIISYIKKNKISEKEIYLPRETQYQMINIIDKINDNKKILELYNIQNFGISWDKINILKDFLIRGEQINENELFKELDTLGIKEILILFKYILISYKKICGSFYKLEIEEINENLYSYFFPNKKVNEKKLNGYKNDFSSFGLKQNLNNNKEKKDKIDKKNKKNNKNKWNQADIIGLGVGKNKEKPKKNNHEQNMKKNFDKEIKKIKEEEEKIEKMKEKENPNIKDNKDNNKKDNKNNNKSKLSMLMASNTNNNKKNTNNKNINNGKFKFKDEDFPPLK